MKRLLTKSKNKLRETRHARVRAKVQGTSERPRLSVFRSLKGMVVQLIDDANSKTLCYADKKTVASVKTEDKSGKVGLGYALGLKIAEMAKEKNIKEVVFDRAGYRYHGRVKAVADGAREGGLKF